MPPFALAAAALLAEKVVRHMFDRIQAEAVGTRAVEYPAARADEYGVDVLRNGIAHVVFSVAETPVRRLPGGVRAVQAAVGERLAGFAGIVLANLDLFIVNIAFPSLAQSFPGAGTGLAWVLNGYTVVYAAMLIPAGGLADTHGRKRVFLLGVSLFLAASAEFRHCFFAVRMGIRLTQATQAGAVRPAPASSYLPVMSTPHPASSRSVTPPTRRAFLKKSLGSSYLKQFKKKNLEQRIRM